VLDIQLGFSIDLEVLERYEILLSSIPPGAGFRLWSSGLRVWSSGFRD
jgi:hypothetical protein